MSVFIIGGMCSQRRAALRVTMGRVTRVATVTETCPRLDCRVVQRYCWTSEGVLVDEKNVNACKI